MMASDVGGDRRLMRYTDVRNHLPRTTILPAKIKGYS